MKIVWDEAKRLTNLEIHGIDFVDVGIASRSRTQSSHRHIPALTDAPASSLSARAMDASSQSSSRPWERKLYRSSAFVRRVGRKGKPMTHAKRPLPDISDAEEAAIQAGIARDA